MQSGTSTLQPKTPPLARFAVEQARSRTVSGSRRIMAAVPEERGRYCILRTLGVGESSNFGSAGRNVLAEIAKRGGGKGGSAWSLRCEFFALSCPYFACQRGPFGGIMLPLVFHRAAAKQRMCALLDTLSARVTLDAASHL